MTLKRALPCMLAIDPDPGRRAALEAALSGCAELHPADGLEAARALLAERDIVAAFVGLDDPDRGCAALGMLARDWPDIARVGVSAAEDGAGFAAEAAGAELHLPTPLRAPLARIAARAAEALFRARRETGRLRAELALRGPRRARAADPERADAFARIVRSPGSPMAETCRAAALVASFDVPALILGETGVGKELLARAIHETSLRSDKPFHAVNCGAIPDELLESELFGHRKGAFTGAHAHRIGLLEEVDRGTIFLDEIGDTSPAFQVKLLRFLQEGEIRPVGSNETLRLDVRVIAACNGDLEAAVQEGRFRADLYYRLAVAPVRIPPLRERMGDLPMLADRLLTRAMAAHGKRVDGIAPEALALLRRWRWPGNIRELENEVLRMLISAQDGRIGPELVSARIRLAAAPPAHANDDVAIALPEAQGGALRDRVERLEARILRETLARHGWNKSRAADELGLSRVGLRAKLDRYGLEPPDSAGLRAAQ
ncbi:MAG: sigma-54 interaction domain-containing protein [Rubrimonas sp.]|uniref:sigma-54 interaction domain-containing protein n=1 Tax=Rubrimonas sp. TaxID=2036015 RepID=UPI002FDD47AE